MKTCLCYSFMAIFAHISLFAVEAPSQQKAVPNSADYRGPLKDQDDTSDIFAIPLDNSEEDEKEEEAALEKKAAKIAREKKEKQNK